MAEKIFIWEQGASTPVKRAIWLCALVAGVNAIGIGAFWLLLHAQSGQLTRYWLAFPSFQSGIPSTEPSPVLQGVPDEMAVAPVANAIGPALQYALGWPIRVTAADTLSWRDAGTAIALAALATFLIAVPFIHFLSHGWYARFDEFRNSLKDGALFSYLRRFWSTRLLDAVDAYRRRNAHEGDPPVTASITDQPVNWPDIEKTSHAYVGNVFERIYTEQYGLRPFVPPFAFIVVITYLNAASVALVNNCVDGTRTCSLYFFGAPATIVISALSGAYMFSVADSVMSIRRRSLNVSDMYWYGLRQFLAVPIAIFFSSGFALSERGSLALSVAASLSFAVALLPIDVLMKVIRRFAFAKLSIAPEEEKGDQLLQLSGMTSPLVALFLSEGVYSIEQVACMDPVLLALRTGLPFSLITRFGSQAIVRRHFGDDAKALAAVGFGDATAFYDLVTRPDTCACYADACDALRACIDGAQRKTPIALIEMKIRHVAREQYTQMLVKLSPLDRLRQERTCTRAAACVTTLPLDQQAA